MSKSDRDGDVKPYEIYFELSDVEREIEAAVLLDHARHFASYPGSLRQAYDAFIAQIPIATDVAMEEVQQEGLNGWWILPRGGYRTRAILFLHGGAYMLGSALAYRGFASQFATRSKMPIFVLDYPLAPEHPFPSAHQAAISALRCLLDLGFSEIGLIGDSAGGGLALSCLSLPGYRMPRIGAVLAISPWTDVALTGGTMANDTVDPIFTASQLREAADTVLNGADPRDGRVSPLYAVPPSVPPLLIQVGANERLLDDSRRYAAAAHAMGGKVFLQVYGQLHHVFHNAYNQLPSARRAIHSGAAFIVDSLGSASVDL